MASEENQSVATTEKTAAEASDLAQSTSVIKNAIISKSAGVDIEKSEYTNLILDDM